ncbi:mechanosensitive ion channel [Candidatus Poribacteria bacterium]|nr:mechanosensitive ion channel [Candidatus Poribacteria bacterium]
MENLTEWIHKTTKLSPAIQAKLFTSIVIILIIWLLRWLVLTIVWQRTEDIRVRYRWRKTSNAVAVGLGAFLVGREWFQGFQSIATFLGLLSAGLAIALKDLVTGVAGWFFIVWRRPFSLGDRVQIGVHTGDVIDIGIFKFTLLEVGNWVDEDQSTGRILHIPNGMALTEVIANYSRGFQYIWNELPILITFESNWEKAKGILHSIVAEHAEHLSQEAEKNLKEASRKFMIFYAVLTPTVYTAVKDSGVLLTIRYLCEPRHRRDSAEAIWEDILREFARCDDIDFAYPTQRFYNNRFEGKSGTKPPPDGVEVL